MRVKADPRHAARKLALTSIFSWLFSEPDYDECLELSKENLLQENVEFDLELLDFIVKGVQKHKSEIDKIIQESAPEWPIDKISKVDLVILRIAVFELVFGKKTPVKVSIDEAVELSKEFGTDTSHKFVNGVLGTVAQIYTENSKKDEKTKNIETAEKIDEKEGGIDSRDDNKDKKVGGAKKTTKKSKPTKSKK